jgi:ketosteroid isomerase-like protein
MPVLEVVAKLHEAQRCFYAGGSSEGLFEVLAKDVQWTVPGSNAIAGRYSGLNEVLAYFARRRDIASGTFTMRTRELLVGDGDHVAALTDGSAVLGGAEEHWSTVGLYRLRGGLIAACWLFPFDAQQFDRIWSP